VREKSLRFSGERALQKGSAVPISHHLARDSHPSELDYSEERSYNKEQRWGRFNTS